jgi:hypothetical protein
MFSTLPKNWFWQKGAVWGPVDYVFLALYVAWWPGEWMLLLGREGVGKGLFAVRIHLHGSSC